MDNKEIVESTSDHYLQVENDVEFSQEKDKDSEEAQKPEAVLMAGFLFWANFTGVVLLLIGFVAPGWLTAKTNQKLHRRSDWYDSDDITRTLWDVYQDYALWYVTQCYMHDEQNTACETMTYRTIDDVYGGSVLPFQRYVIGAMHKRGDDRFMFHGAGLAFSYSDIVRAQSLYTTGLLIALATVYKWYQFRTDVARNKLICLSKRKRALLLVLTVLSAIFILAPVYTFVMVYEELGKHGYEAKVDTSIGSVFAGFGGSVMVVIAITVFIQLVCCRGTYTCTYSCRPGGS